MRTKALLTALGALALAANHPVPPAVTGPEAPMRESGGDDAVQIGLDGPEMDACGGVGRVSLNSRELAPTLTVHQGNRRSATRLAELPTGTLVWLCEARGEWQGIVWPGDSWQDLGDCQVSSPLAAPEAYAGPCKSGWVEADKLSLVAG